MPEAAPTAATAVLLLFHTPPALASFNVVAAPAHTEAVPVIDPAFGNGLTVTAAVAVAVPHTVVAEYDIVVLPAAIPVTTPVLPTVATDVALLLQTPPGARSLSVVVAVAHTVKMPVMEPAIGNGLTVNVCDAVAVPQLLVTE